MRFRAAVLALSIVIVSASATISNAAPAGAATETYGQVLASLTTAVPHSDGYSRTAFTLWIDADHDGCNTRAEVLKAESSVPVTIAADTTCTVESGQWLSWYDKATWTNASDVDIDHLVPLGEAWASGAYSWTSDQRMAYANDLGYDHTLEAVTDNVNQSKGDKDPANWLPTYDRCRYAQYWVTVKYRWNLTLDTAESSSLGAILAGPCGDATVTDFPAKADTPLPDPTGMPGSTAPVPALQRFSGADRYATAVAISSHYAAGVPAVYIATGANYPDALSAAPAAAAEGGPLLLTTPTVLPSNVAAEIQRLSPQKIVVAGSNAVVSDRVFTQLKQLQSNTVRYAGADRYATSRAINSHVFASGSNTVFIATGQNYPDALTASAVAGGLHAPVMLVNGMASSIDSPTRTLLTQLAPSTINIAGSASVVTTAIENALRMPGVTVNRYAGSNRYATSQAINAAAFTTAPTAYFATGSGFADALAGAAIAARDDAPLYVVPTACVPSGVITSLTTLSTEHRILLGSTAVLTSGVANLTPCATAPPKPPTPPVPPVIRGVQPGAFCSPIGSRGLTSKGTAMICGFTAASPTRARWHAA